MTNQFNRQPADDASAAELTPRRDDDAQPFDTNQLTEKLCRDMGLEAEMAAKISHEVYRLVRQTGLRVLCPSLIRGLIDVKLIEYGFDEEYRAHIQVGLPLRDIERLVQQLDRPRGVRPLDARETALALAGVIKREFAMLTVYSESTANAHMNGEIHIENADAVDCLYGLSLSPDYLKRAGSLLPPRVGVTRAPRQPHEFVTRLVQSSSALARCLSGPLCWDSLNYALAPLIDGWNAAEIHEFAEDLLGQLNSLGMDCEIYLDWDAPVYLADRHALAIDGSELGESYREYRETARQLLVALLELYLSGDQTGLPLLTPRPIVYLPADPVQAGAGFEMVSRLARERGHCEVRFARADRDAFRDRYGLKMTTAMQADSWEWRTGVFQAVAINLPRAAFRSSGDPVRVFETLTEMLDTAAQAHLEKRIYLEKLLAQGEHGPLALLARRRQGSALLKLNRTLHWICPVGLDEMVLATLGQHLYESDEALEFSKQVCQHLAHETERLSAKHKVQFLLAHLNSSDIARRMARLDLRDYPEAAAESLPPATDSETVCYTPGLGLPVIAKLPPGRRVQIEAMLQAYSAHRAASVWRVSANPPPFPEESKEWLTASMREAGSAGLRPCLNFSFCLECQSALRGTPTSCSACQSTLVRHYV